MDFVDETALDALISEINFADRPPEGVPAGRITVLNDRSAGKVEVAVRFGSEENLPKGAEAFGAMSSPNAGTLCAASPLMMNTEVVLERQARSRSLRVRLAFV